MTTISLRILQCVIQRIFLHVNVSLYHLYSFILMYIHVPGTLLPLLPLLLWIVIILRCDSFVTALQLHDAPWVLIRRLCEALRCSKCLSAPRGSKLCSLFLDTSERWASGQKSRWPRWTVSTCFDQSNRFKVSKCFKCEMLLRNLFNSHPVAGAFRNCSWSHCLIFTREVKFIAIRSHLSDRSLAISYDILRSWRMRFEEQKWTKHARFVWGWCRT